MKLSDYVMAFLADRGVRHIFLLPGGGAMHLNDSLARSASIRPVANLHEQGAAIAAEAYARVTGGLGAAMVTCGPGGTNAVTGVAAAWLDSTPVIFISGQVKRADLKNDSGLRQSGVQEIDIVAIVRSITKYAVTVTDPVSIRFHLEKACHLATSGRRGPVWIDIPLDVQGSDIDADHLEKFEPGTEVPIVGRPPLAESIQQAVALLKSSRRPVVLLGNGIRTADAIAPMRKWLHQLQAPILTTWLGLDLVPDCDPLLAGRPGGIAPRGANFTLQNCDCFVSLGARLDPVVTAYAHEKFARGARKIIVDIDPAEIAKLRFTIDCPVPADLADFFRAWERQASAEVFPDWQPWRSRCQAWKKKYPLLQPSHLPQKGEAMSMYYFARALSDLLPEDELIVPGSSGFACEIFFLMLEVKPGQRVFHNRGTGSMGLSVPAALGASVAAGGKRVVSVDGDGGFQMNLQELAVIAGLQLPVKFFVINNGGYASIRSSQDNYFQRRHIASDRASGLFLPPLPKLAEAYGAGYCRIEGEASLREKIEHVLASPGPVVCEVMVRENEPREPRLASFVRPDGSMVSRPLEDLYPFLDRAEFRENMIVPPLDESLVNS
jgi:acetolactate synthase-1/2/3 large subunit